ncbi:hypothetical protein ANN_14114 [Periplaneta americana]|uniref:Uncharacterized protein n=1 Tax=Periplaneta americana TaxID=6978 RepID=A0ABQ8SVF1_PERAM|nr:hypothetical protein ANN_14114 [Periplaneta americana]
MQSLGGNLDLVTPLFHKRAKKKYHEITTATKLPMFTLYEDGNESPGSLIAISIMALERDLQSGPKIIDWITIFAQCDDHQCQNTSVGSIHLCLSGCGPPSPEHSEAIHSRILFSNQEINRERNVLTIASSIGAKPVIINSAESELGALNSAPVLSKRALPHPRHYATLSPVQSRLLAEASCNVEYKYYITGCFYGCETWTLTLREEQRLRVFENKVLRKIFGAKRDEVTGEWRKLHNTELHALYSSPDIIRNIKSRHLSWAGHVARMGESRNANSLLVGRPEGKRPLGRPRCRWEDNIKMDLREVGYDGRDWINLAQDRDQWRAYVRAAMNFRFLRSHLQISYEGHVDDESSVEASLKLNVKSMKSRKSVFSLLDIHNMLKSPARGMSWEYKNNRNTRREKGRGQDGDKDNKENKKRMEG